jgi:hypothetical protein
LPDPPGGSEENLPSASDELKEELEAQNQVLEEQIRAVEEQAQWERWGKFQPALDLALDEFLATAQWPQRERFRRQLSQGGLGHLDLDEMWRNMPRSPWEQATSVPDRIVLSLQALQEMSKARPLLDTCIAIARRAYELYLSDTVEPRLRSDDPVLLSAAGGDALLLLCAREVLDQHRPDPMGVGEGLDSTDWYRMLNDAVMSAFKGVVTVDDYLDVQAKIIASDRKIYGRASLPPRPSSVGGAAVQPAQPSAASTMHAGESLGSASAAESPAGEDNKKSGRSELDRIVNRWGPLAAAVAAIVGALSDLTKLGWLTYLAFAASGYIAYRYWRNGRRLLSCGLALLCLICVLLSVRTSEKPATTMFFYGGWSVTYPKGLPYSSLEEVPLTTNPAIGSTYDTIQTEGQPGSYTFFVSCTSSGQYDGKPLNWAHIVSGTEQNLWIPVPFLEGIDAGKTYGLLSCSSWQWLLHFENR